MRRIFWIALLIPLACVEGVDPPAFGVYQVSGIVAELDGFGVGPTGPGPGRMLLVRTALSGPTSQPDVVTSTMIPYCIASAFTLAKLPGGNSTDGGDVVFGGLQPTMPGVMVRDQLTMIDVPVGNSITCAQGEDSTASPGESGIRHQCNVPTVGFIAAPEAAVAEGTITVSAAGGSQVGAFTSMPLEVPEVLTATGAFDVRAVDPRAGVLVEWSTVNAGLVLVELLAFRSDGVGGQVLCLELMSAGRIQMSEEILLRLPMPTPTDGVDLFTSLAAVNADTADEGWGTYIVGAGRGTFGLTRLPSSP